MSKGSGEELIREILGAVAEFVGVSVGKESCRVMGEVFELRFGGGAFLLNVFLKGSSEVIAGPVTEASLGEVSSAESNVWERVGGCGVVERVRTEGGVSAEECLPKTHG